MTKLPFNLEAAKAGAPLVTRDGFKASYTGELEDPIYPLRIYVAGRHQCYTAKGEMYSDKVSAWDLFLLAPSEPTYTIKPLEWEFLGQGNTETWSAAPEFDQSYFITRALISNGEEKVWEDWMLYIKGNDTDKECDSIDHGKALAQADWQERLLPALQEVKG